MGDGLRFFGRRIGGGEDAKLIFHSLHEGDVVVDCENTHNLAFGVTDENGAGLQNLAIFRTGQVSQTVFQLAGVSLQGFPDNMRRAIAHTAAGNMAVFNGNNGIFQFFGTQIMDNDFAIGTKLTGNALGQVHAEADFKSFHCKFPFRLIRGTHYSIKFQNINDSRKKLFWKT